MPRMESHPFAGLGFCETCARIVVLTDPLKVVKKIGQFGPLEAHQCERQTRHTLLSQHFKNSALKSWCACISLPHLPPCSRPSAQTSILPYSPTNTFAKAQSLNCFSQLVTNPSSFCSVSSARMYLEIWWERHGRTRQETRKAILSILATSMRNLPHCYIDLGWSWYVVYKDLFGMIYPISSSNCSTWSWAAGQQVSNPCESYPSLSPVISCIQATELLPWLAEQGQIAYD